jgi:hypothetical protein
MFSTKQPFGGDNTMWCQETLTRLRREHPPAHATRAHTRGWNGIDPEKHE